MPTLEQTVETEKFLVKIYGVSKRQMAFEDTEYFFYATFLRKGTIPPKYEHIPLGIPELEKILREFRKAKQLEGKA